MKEKTTAKTSREGSSVRKLAMADVEAAVINVMTTAYTIGNNDGRGDPLKLYRALRDARLELMEAWARADGRLSPKTWWVGVMLPAMRVVERTEELCRCALLLDLNAQDRTATDLPTAIAAALAEYERDVAALSNSTDITFRLLDATPKKRKGNGGGNRSNGDAHSRCLAAMMAAMTEPGLSLTKAAKKAGTSRQTLKRRSKTLPGALLAQFEAFFPAEAKRPPLGARPRGFMKDNGDVEAIAPDAPDVDDEDSTGRNS